MLGAGDVSVGCGKRLRRSGGHPRALAIFRPYPVDLASEWWRGFTLQLWCTDEALRGGCPARVAVLDAGGHTVAHQRVTLRRGHARDTIYMAYSRSFARRLRRTGALAVTVVASAAGHTDRLHRCAQSDSNLDRKPLPCG